MSWIYHTIRVYSRHKVCTGVQYSALSSKTLIKNNMQDLDTGTYPSKYKHAAYHINKILPTLHGGSKRRDVPCHNTIKTKSRLSPQDFPAFCPAVITAGCTQRGGCGVAALAIQARLLWLFLACGINHTVYKYRTIFKHNTKVPGINGR